MLTLLILVLVYLFLFNIENILPTGFGSFVGLGFPIIFSGVSIWGIVVVIDRIRSASYTWKTFVLLGLCLFFALPLFNIILLTSVLSYIGLI